MKLPGSNSTLQEEIKVCMGSLLPWECNEGKTELQTLKCLMVSYRKKPTMEWPYSDVVVIHAGNSLCQQSKMTKLVENTLVTLFMRSLQS